MLVARRDPSPKPFRFAVEGRNACGCDSHVLSGVIVVSHRMERLERPNVSAQIVNFDRT